MWESQVLNMDGQPFFVVFFFCRFSGFRPLLRNDQLDLSEIFLKGRKTQIPLKLPLRTVWKVYYFHSRYAIMLRYQWSFFYFRFNRMSSCARARYTFFWNTTENTNKTIVCFILTLKFRLCLIFICFLHGNVISVTFNSCCHRVIVNKRCKRKWRI